MKKDNTSRTKIVLSLMIFLAVGCRSQISTPSENTPAPSETLPVWETATSTETYMPTSPSYLSDGWLIFSGDSYIYSLDAISSDLHILTDNGHYFSQVWLKNGYVYYVEGTPYHHLYRMKHDGSEVEQMEGGKEIFFFDVSSDGRHLAYASGSYITLVEFDISGTTVVGRIVLNRQFSIESLVWANDGERLAFIEVRRDEDGQENLLYVVDADGKNEMPIQSGDLRISTRSPAWSPDGSNIAIPMKDQFGVNLYLIDLYGGNEIHPLTSMVGKVKFPLWSPDGTKILFMHNEQLCVIGADGSSFQVIADKMDFDSSNTYQAAWSPDGRYITYAGKKDNLISLFIIPSTGGAPMNLGVDQYHIVDLSWVLSDH